MVNAKRAFVGGARWSGGGRGDSALGDSVVSTDDVSEQTSSRQRRYSDDETTPDIEFEVPSFLVQTAHYAQDQRDSGDTPRHRQLPRSTVVSALFPNIRNLPKIFLRSFENVAPVLSAFSYSCVR